MGSPAGGSASSRPAGSLTLDLPDEAWFDVELAHRDIRPALATGRSDDIPLPSAALGDEWLTPAAFLGYGHRDIASRFAVLAQQMGRSRVWPSAREPPKAGAVLETSDHDDAGTMSTWSVSTREPLVSA